MQFIVGKIKAQKDEYVDHDGQALSFRAYWEGDAQEAFVKEFKRVKVAMTLKVSDIQHKFELLCLPRSSTIRVVSTDGPATPADIFATLYKRMRRFWGPGELPQPAQIAAKAGSCEVAVHDAMWYAAILHEMLLYGPIETDDNSWQSLPIKMGLER